jgi:hypothetical protein
MSPWVTNLWLSLLPALNTLALSKLQNDCKWAQGPRFYAAFSSGRTTPRLEYLAIDNEIDGEPKMPY